MFAWDHSGASRVRRVHSSTRGFMTVVGFIRSRVRPSDTFVIAWVHSGSPSGRPVHSGSLWFTMARLGVVWFLRDRVGSLGSAYGLLGSFRLAWVHSGATRGRRFHST